MCSISTYFIFPLSRQGYIIVIEKLENTRKRENHIILSFKDYHCFVFRWFFSGFVFSLFSNRIFIVVNSL